MKQKRIKAYAIITPKGELIGSWTYPGYEIYQTRSEAKDSTAFDDDGKEGRVVPVEILLPTKSKNKCL